MINHIRTLLLNGRSQDIQPVPYPGEEYLPVTFVPKRMPGTLGNVHRVIFGSNPDRAMLNYRLRELMAILHSGELEEFVLAPDPRITYWPLNKNDIVNAILRGPVITHVTGTEQLSISKPPGVITAGERLYYSFGVTVTDGSHVTITDLLAIGPPTVSSYSITNGLSSLVAFPGTTVSFSFAAGVGSQWLVTWLAKPVRTLANVHTDLTETMTSDLVDALFGTNPAEPFRSWRNLWLDSNQLPYRLGAAALALSYQLDLLGV